MVRRYSGPLQPGRRSAYVKGSRKNRRKQSKDKQQDKRIKVIEKKLQADKKMTDIAVPLASLQQPDSVGNGVKAFHLLNALQKGDNICNREGEKITLKNIFMNLKVAAEANVPLSITNLVLVHFPEGLPPNTQTGTTYSWATTGAAIDRFTEMTKSLPDPFGMVHSYITDDNLYGDNQSTFKPLFNPNTNFRYNILFNKQIRLNNGSTATTFGSKHERFIRVSLKKHCLNKTVEYDVGSAGVVAPTEVVKGSYVLYAWSDRPSTETGRPAVSGGMRVKWIG